MTIEELRNYRKIVAVIAFWRRELQDQEKRSFVSSPQGGTGGGGGISDPTSMRAVHEADMYLRIKALEEQREAEAERIVAWIEEIQDPLIQAIMYARYIKGLTWERVAATIGGSTTPGALRLLHYRFMGSQ